MRICLLQFYVPKSHLETVKNALFGAGAGRLGLYDCCAWQTEGEGQFRPLAGSRPFSGEVGKLERTAEYKVEMICEETCLEEAVAALKKAHPYETPSYAVIKIESFMHGDY